MNAYARQAVSRRDELIREHVELARRIAGRLARRLPPNITLDEVMAAAMLGLAEAADRYDPSRGEPFEAFAPPRIRGEILDELRRGDLLPRRKRSMVRRIGEATALLENQLGRAAEEHEVARELGVPVAEYRAELGELAHVAMVELDEAAVTSDTDVEGRAHLASPFATAARAELKRALVAALKALPERSALMMALYYDEELTFAEIARVLGVTESRVCQIHTQTVLRLRAQLGATEEEGE